ncbi:glycosyltransferase [Qipengyuania sp.]|uniref:glycosyltransferase n=1 Tax=Qipengyuania sp. TaxID=2004515 RepID=UPI003736FE64
MPPPQVDAGFRFGADHLAALLAAAPFGGRVTVRGFAQNVTEPLDYAVALPVRNEEGYLPRTLAALGAAMKAAPQAGGLVAVVNNSSDASAALIRAWAAEGGVPLCLADVAFDPAIRNAPHARRLALDVAARLVPGGLLLTSDADSRVAPDWAARMVALWQQGCQLLWEDIRLDEAELAALPARVRAVGDAERDFFAASSRLWRRWTDADTPPFAVRASGASMAVCAAAYRALGGLPTPSVGEDKALAQAVLERGFAIGELKDGGTVTSGRFEGRADGGCATALRERATHPDPACDEALIPVRALRRRAALWNALPAGHERFRLFAERLRCDAQSQLPRMHYAEVLRELAIAEALLAGEDGGDYEGLSDVA